jgi:CRP/FNR family transcriptional regulator
MAALHSHWSEPLQSAHHAQPPAGCAVEQGLGGIGLGVTLTAAAGQTIVVEGDPLNHYYRILSGTVRLYNAVSDGRRQVLDFLGSDECFGLTGLDRFAYSVEAISPVTIVRYPRQRLDAVVEQSPELAARLFRQACIELGQAQRQMLLLGRKSADEKIASFLLEMAERQAGLGRPSDILDLPMSRQDIADHLGLTIETVSRTISRFKRSGVIVLTGRQHVILKDMARLRRLAALEAAA